MKLVSEKGFSTDDRRDRDWQLKSTGKIFFFENEKKVEIFRKVLEAEKSDFFSLMFSIKKLQKAATHSYKEPFSAIYAMLESELFYWVEISLLA